MAPKRRAQEGGRQAGVNPVVPPAPPPPRAEESLAASRRFFVGRKALLTASGVRDIGAEVFATDLRGGQEQLLKLLAAGVLVER